MSRNSTLILLGILIILAPFSGLPMSIRSLLTVVFGACVSGIGLALRMQEARALRSRAEVSSPSAATLTMEPQSTNSTSEASPQKPHGVSPV